MKKAILVLAGLALATTAHAEHKLLVTEVLAKKQVEAQAGVEYAHATADFTEKATGEKGKLTVNTSEAKLSVGAGLGYGLELSASVPYLMSEREQAKLAGAIVEESKVDGLGNLSMEAKYAVPGFEGKPLKIAAGLGATFDTARRKDRAGRDTNVSPFVAASYDLGHHYVPYAMYRATFSNEASQDAHTLTLGLEKELNHTFTLDAKAETRFNVSNDRFDSNQDYRFELGAYVNVAHNLYVLPAVAYTASTGFTAKAADIDVDDSNGFQAGVAVYYLY